MTFLTAFRNTCLILLLGNVFAHAQTKYPSDETLHEVCGTFLKERILYLQNPSQPADAFKAVASDSMFLYYTLYRDYLALNNPYPNIPETTYDHLILTTKTGPVCVFEAADGRITEFIFKQENGVWKIADGANPNPLSYYLNNLQKEYDTRLANHAEELLVGRVLQQFWQGMKNLHASGDTTLLYASVTPEAYKTMKAQYEIEKLQGSSSVKRYQSDSLVIDQTDISNDTARVHVHIPGKGSSTMNLLKQNGTWRVAGENATWNNASRMEQKQEDLTQLQLKHDARQCYNQLQLALNDLFIEKDMAALNAVATPSMVHLVGKCMLKVPATYNTSFLIPAVKEGIIPLHFFDEQRFRIQGGDTINFGDGSDIIQFVKYDGVYKFAGFHNSYNGPFTDAFVADCFNDFIGLRGFYYDPYAGTTVAVELSATDTDQPEEKKYVHTCFELKQQPHFTGGGEALYTFIGANMKQPLDAKKNKLDGAVYVNFIVEKSGLLTDVTVTSSPHEALSAEAIRLVKSMPAWQPGISDYANEPVRSWHTLVVWFGE